MKTISSPGRACQSKSSFRLERSSGGLPIRSALSAICDCALFSSACGLISCSVGHVGQNLRIAAVR
jgi:hypothetical protein